MTDTTMDDLREKVEEAKREHAEKIEAFLAMLDDLAADQGDPISWDQVKLVHTQEHPQGEEIIKWTYKLEMVEEAGGGGSGKSKDFPSQEESEISPGGDSDR